MAVQSKCPQCGKRYVAPDKMAGRRVRCRQCNTVFALSTESMPEPDLNAATGAGGQSWAGAELASSDGSTVSHVHVGTIAGATTGLEAEAADAAGADLQAVQQAAGESARPGWAAPPRSNPGFDFPGSREVDRWLPAVLVLIAGAWLVAKTASSNETGAGWVTYVRLLAFVLMFVIVVFPAGLTTLRRTARKLNILPPPNAAWRTFAVYFFPFAACVAIWLTTGGTLTGVALGCVAGTIALAGGLWLLFRLREQDLPLTLGAGVGAFVAAVAVAFLLLALVNQFALAMGGTPDPTARSPLGPGLPWYAKAEAGPAKDGKKVPERTSTPAAVADGGNGSEADDAGTTATTDTPQDAVGNDVASAAGDGDPSSDPPPADPGKPAATVLIPEPSVANRVGAVNTGANLSPGTAVATPDGTGGPSQPTAAAAAPTSRPSLAAAVVEPLKDVAQEVVFPDTVPPDGTPVVMATVRAASGSAAAQQDRVQLWIAHGGGTDWRPHGNPLFISRPSNEPVKYHLSPEGTRLAYLTNFPKLAVRVASFETGGFSDVPLALPQGLPRLIGFASPNIVAVHWESAGRSAVEVWNVQSPGGAAGGTPKPLRQVEMVGLTHAPGYFALSPDGRSLAVIARTMGSAKLNVYPLVQPRGGGRRGGAADGVLSVGLDQVDLRHQDIRPTGLQFSPDGTRLAALFERPGHNEALFVYWTIKDNPASILELRRYEYFGPLQPAAGRPAFQDQSLRWMAGGRLWLIYGSALFDVRHGRVLGDLGIPDVVAAHAPAGGDTCLLTRAVTAPSGERGYTVSAVRLNLTPEVLAGEAGSKTPSNTRLFDVPQTQ